MTRFQSLPPGFRGSILKSKTTNNAVTVPVPQKTGLWLFSEMYPRSLIGLPTTANFGSFCSTVSLQLSPF